mmetsp:Transcript_107692/g.347609  ORF Transcript_107692/g.347609 Transcript_107692/m.347609 type:complete len:533 (-) Transcript_107692:542-2140(-)
MYKPHTHANIHVTLRCCACLHRLLVVCLLAAQDLLQGLLKLALPRVAGQLLAREALHQVQEGHAAAGPPVLLGDEGAYGGVVDHAAVGLQEVLAGLLHGHLREHVAVVVAAGLVSEDVRDSDHGQRGGAAPHALLHLGRQPLHALRRELRLRQLVERALEVGHREHAPQGEDRVGVAAADVLLQQLPGHDLAFAVAAVAAAPGGVAHQGVHEHALVLGVGHGHRRALLGEERRGLRDVRHVGRVAGLVHQRRQRRVARADLLRVRQGREVRNRGLPGAVGAHPCGLGPVAETIGVLALAVEQVQGHCGALVVDAQRCVRPDPTVHGLLEGEVGVQLLCDITREHEVRVPGLQGVLALLRDELPARLLQLLPGALLQGVEDAEEALLAEPLGLGHLVVVKVDVAKGLGHTVPQLHQLHEAVVADKGADGLEPLEAGLARGLVRICAHHVAEAHRGELHEALPWHFSAELHLVPRGLQRAFDAGGFLPERPRSLVLHDVALEGPLEHPKDLGLVLAGLPALEPLARLLQALGVC